MTLNSAPCKSNILLIYLDHLQTTRKLHYLLVHNRHKFILRFRHLIVGIISTHSLQMSESYPPDPPMSNYTNGKEYHLNNGSKTACCGLRAYGISSWPKTLYNIRKSFIPTYRLNLTLSTKFYRNGAGTVAGDKFTPSPSCSDSIMRFQCRQLGSHLWQSYHKDQLLQDSL